MSRPSTNTSRPGSTSSRNSLQSTGKLSDSTAKLLEDMAKRSGLALKQINELKQASTAGYLPPSRLQTAQSQQPMTLLLEEARPVPLNPLNYTGSRRTDILQEQRPAYRGEGKAGVNRDELRETLAKRMEFGGQLPAEILKQAGRKPAVGKSKPAPPDEFDRIIEEVTERLDFLESMTALGQRAKYETIVKAQVAEKLHDLRVM